MRKGLFLIAAGVAFAANCAVAGAADLKILSAGAVQNAVSAAIPAFERQTGHKITLAYDTAGALTNRIARGEAFDVAVLTPAAIDDLITKNFLAPGSRSDLARVGVGVMVKVGAPRPDISTVDAFKSALLAARTVGYIDPASGGSSGIYFHGLIDRLGIGAPVRAKAKLKFGGAVADLVDNGEAEIGIHQISEILPHHGVTLIGPLPAEIQSYTVYAAGLSRLSANEAASRAFIAALKSADAAQHYRDRGMEPVN